MKQIITKILCSIYFLFLLVGCATSLDFRQDNGASGESNIITSLNKQIEEWNEIHAGNGVSRIEERVLRVVYNPLFGKVTCFDKDEEAFLVLKRRRDGSFKGILKVDYYFIYSDPEAEFSEEWGVISAEFHIEKEMF